MECKDFEWNAQKWGPGKAKKSASFSSFQLIEEIVQEKLQGMLISTSIKEEISQHILMNEIYLHAKHNPNVALCPKWLFISDSRNNLFVCNNSFS